MIDEFKKLLPELVELKSRLECEIADWEAHCSQLSEWRRDALAKQEAMFDTIERWNRMIAFVTERIENDRDAADWWKSRGEDEP